MNSKLTKAIKLALLIYSGSMVSACMSVYAGMGVDPERSWEPEKMGEDPSQYEDRNSTAENTKTVNKAKQTSKSTSAKPSEKRTQTSGGPLEDQPLIFDTEGLIDDDGIGQLTYQWQVKEPTGRWVTVQEALSQSFTPRQVHVNKALRARIEYLDGQGTLESIITPATLPVQNINDLPNGKLLLSGDPLEDQTLQIDASSVSDEDGMGLITYSWERSKDGLQWSRYPIDNSDPSLLKLQQEHVGYAFRGRISYTDGFGSNESMATTVSGVVKNLDDPAIGPLMITGSLLKGSKLNVDTSLITDEDGIASISITWQTSENGGSWQVASDIKNRELTLNKNHVGKIIRARAVVVDNFGNQAKIFSSVSTPVQNVNSRPTGVIRIITAE